MDGGDVGGDGMGRFLHLNNGVGGVYEVSVTGTDELTELLFLELDLGPGRGLHISDLGNGLGSEQRLGVSESAAAERGGPVGIGSGRHSHCDLIH